MARSPLHLPPALRPEPMSPPEGEERFMHRPCYVFNHALRIALDDTGCSHCRHYLTSTCPHIDEFLDDVEDLSPD